MIKIKLKANKLKINNELEVVVEEYDPEVIEKEPEIIVEDDNWLMKNDEYMWIREYGKSEDEDGLK